MSRSLPPELRSGLSKWSLGFFGAAVAYLLFPSFIRFIFRRVFLRLIVEVISFITLGLLTEKLVDHLTKGR